MLWAYSQRRINLITFTLDCLKTFEHITDLWLQLIIITIISLKLQRREVSWCNFINYHTSSKCSCKKASPSPNKCLAHFLTKQENTISMPLPSNAFLNSCQYVTRKAYHTVWIFSNFDYTSLKKGCNFCKHMLVFINWSNSNHTFVKQYYLLSFEKRLHDLQRPSHCTFQQCELKIKAHWISFKTV